jgi:molybdate transport system ATP-binding protein
MLSIDAEKTLGEFSLSAKFEASGGITALFGPSGSGKTSLISMIAGLLTPDRGRIVIDGETVFDSAQRVNVPPYRRRIGYVFQEGRLFPHLSVRRNLDYGRWISGQPADAAAFAQTIELLDIGALLDRRPGKLSGGERQRAAIGRALLMRPRLLLLDEPLASLDAARKADILPYLERLRDGAKVPMIYVSHDAAEVKRIASRVVRLDGGKVTATGGAELLSA